MKINSSSPWNAAPSSQSSSSRAAHRIFLVEDHPITRAGFALLVGREPDLCICGEADNAPAALAAILKARPALVVSDIALRGSSGLELMKGIKVMHPDIRILAMSMHDEGIYAERALRAGANGYMMKLAAVDEIIPAIRAVLAGEVYLSESIKGKLVARMFAQRKTPHPVFPIDTLSDREMEVFDLIGNGFSTREIAARLRLSTKTIDSYREHMKLKLGVDNGAELVRRAIQWCRADGSLPR